MEGITNGSFTSQDWTHFKYPLSISPLPTSMKPGMIALCVFALLSCLATLGLMGFLTYRSITSRNEYRAPLYKNQYVLLIFSLVLADFQCDLGFFLDAIWLHKNQIVAPSAACFLQGWLVNIGDLSSGFFVFAIACHTFYNVVCGRKIGLATLQCCIVGLWVFAVVLTITPIALHPKNIFVTQGNWCSINAEYNILRLYFHYIWVFIAEGAVLIMYGTTYIVLRKRMGIIKPQLAHMSATTDGNGATAKNRKAAKISRISRATMYMILYPLIYVLSTLPLAAGRIASMVGHTPSKNYLMAAGTLMACGGWMNCLLYSFTRRIFIHSSKEDAHPDQRRSRYGPKSSAMRSASDGIELAPSGGKMGSRYRELPSPVASTDNIVKVEMGEEEGSDGFGETNGAEEVGGVMMKTEWEVKVEEVKTLERTANKAGLGHRTFITY